jgi:hypothetical protein
MCNNISPNHFRLSYEHEVKYPYSNLKRHHGNYRKLVDVFFKSMYKYNYYTVLEEKCIVIEIHDVNPYKMYNPHNFEPSYKVKTIDGDIDFISTFDIFETFYSYLPDIVPYMEFELYVPYGYDRSNDLYFMHDITINSRGYFERFNLRDLYYQYESRRQQYTVTRRVNSWMDNDEQFVWE